MRRYFGVLAHFSDVFKPPAGNLIKAHCAVNQRDVSMNRRGQAFDTMMLVISVIVAVAILGLLLGFISNINSFGTKASDEIPSLMKTVNQKGYGMALQEKVEFDPGDVITGRTVVGDVSVLAKDVQFVCANHDASCSSGGAMSLDKTNGILYTSGTKLSLTVAVCYDDSSQIYFVIVGSKTTDVQTEAVNECHL